MSYNDTVRQHFFAATYIDSQHPLWHDAAANTGEAGSVAYNDSVAFVLSGDHTQLIAKARGNPYLVALANQVCETYAHTQQFSLAADGLAIPAERRYVVLLVEEALNQLRDRS